MSWLFMSEGPSLGASASAPVLPVIGEKSVSEEEVMGLTS